MTLAEVEASFLHLSLSVCHFLSQALFSSAQIISIYLSFFFCLPFLNANLGLLLVTASRSLLQLIVQCDLPAHHTYQPECSVNHATTIWKRKWAIHTQCLVEGCTFGICCFYTQSPSKLSSCQKILQIICVCSSYFFLFNSVIFTQRPSFRIIFFHIWFNYKMYFYSELINAWKKIPARNIKTLFRFHNLLISLITMIV